MDRSMDRRDFIKSAGLAAGAALLPGFLSCSDVRAAERPNIVIIFCDDLGYGDLTSFGHPTIHTPNLDELAAGGQKWTSFYAAASVCTPSRAGLVTGRYPIRSGMCSDESRVLFPDSTGGLPASEITIAEALKDAGYATGCVGKWHLGHLQQYLPPNHGFDYYFGIPYSNDMSPEQNDWEGAQDFPPTPLIEGLETIEKEPDQSFITERYTEKAVQFIRDNADQPFFLYFPHTFPHTPLYANPDFEDTSLRGLYGDVVEEIDWSVGEVMRTLREEGIEDNTLVVFTSDNGPWLVMGERGGSAGLLRHGKGTTWEGGMREPTIFYWPGKIQPGVVMDMGATLDLLPTACAVAGASVPEDRIIDGYDLSPVLFDGDSSPRDSLIYYRGEQVFAARKGPYKAHFITQGAYGQGVERTVHDTPLLFNLDTDPEEEYNIAEDHPDVIDEIQQMVDEHR
ncbi:MAG: sulfatase-like hydrolase/transferase, partial [Candidatus Marinimicrobia bacterium]|nr:sulfatase-like hydrolase/transferase [Candidatus Neomarinimicrobiota bacterium]